MVAGSLAGAAARRREQGVHLRVLEVQQRALRRLFDRKGGELGAPGQVLGTSRPDEASEGVYRREPLVARGHRAVPLVFQVRQEATNDVWREMFNFELIDLVAQLLRREWQQQNQGVPVARLRIPGQVEIRDDVLQEKASYPRSHEMLVAHDWASTPT